MANEIQLTAATGTPQLIDGRDIDYSGTTRVRPVVTFADIGADPSFWVISGALVPTANRFQFVLYNNNATAVVRVKYVIMMPVSAAVVSSTDPSEWILRKRIGPTTDPTGTGGLTINSFDSADSLPSSITAFSNPSTVPAGGTAQDCMSIIPGTWELQGTGTITTSSMNAFTSLGGYVIFDAGSNELCPIVLRQDQCLELQQSATAGTETVYRIHCAFTAAT